MEDSTEGMKWSRRNYICGQEVPGYTLLKITDDKGRKTEFFSLLEQQAPQVMVILR